MADSTDLDSLKDKVNALGGQSSAGGSMGSTGMGKSPANETKKSPMGPGGGMATPKEKVGQGPSSLDGPVGLDVGTSHIVMAHQNGNGVETVHELNAFFTVPNAKFSKDILTQNNVRFF